jgi:hypothetical protein
MTYLEIQLTQHQEKLIYKYGIFYYWSIQLY